MTEPVRHDVCEGVTLYQGDALSVLPLLPAGSVEAVVTDPPYTAAGGSTNGRSGGHAADTQFFLHWLRAVWTELRRVVSPAGCAFLFCDWRTAALIAEACPPKGDTQRAQFWKVTQALVWDRECFGLGTPFRNSYEMIVFARGPDWQNLLPKDIPTVLRCRWPYGGGKEHGAEKPVPLCRQLVSWACPEGGVVLDPFMGSGTVGVAAAGSGRRFVGIDSDEDSFAVASRRLASPSHQPALPRLAISGPLFDRAPEDTP